MKGIAVPYIIAVLLGIAVIGIIGYWFFFLGGSLGGEVSAQDCNRKLITYCSLWLAQGYGDTPAEWDTYAKGCTQINIGEPDDKECNRLLGRGEVTGTGGAGSGFKTGCTAPTFLTGQGGCSACTEAAKGTNEALKNACNSCC